MADDVNADTVPALLLGRYRTEGLLGEGGLGTVVKAFDTRLKRTVAIKTLKRTSYTVDPDLFRSLEERFAREAEAGSRMGSHPNLVTVYDLVTDTDRTQYLILEYVPGGTLADRLKAGPLPRADALRLTADAARGLQAAHNAGIVHRDVKPANIFLGEDGRAQVGDFGIAQIDDISGRTRTTSGHPGTPLYMSPEQERMTAYLRPSSDQYSLGLVTFEMITGQIYKRIGSRQGAQLLAAQVMPVQNLIAKMLADDPDDRYPTMTEVIHALLAIERHIASEETPTLMRARSERVSERELAMTRHDTPRVGLQPMPPVAIYAPPPALPSAPRYSRRAVLVGAGGLALAAGTAGVTMANLRNSDAAIATATPPVVPLAAVAAITQPPATATISPTATTVPPIVVTAPPAAPIVITAPPIVITATPLPTPIATPTPLPTLAPPPTATLQPATSTPPPTPPPRLPTVAPTPLRQVQLVTWTDQQGRFKIGYPTTWQPTKNPSPSVVEFIGQGIGLEVVAFLNATSTPTQQIANIRANRPTSRRFVDGPTKSTSVGGESGAFMQFESFGLSDSTDVHDGAFWVVTHAGTLYQFNGYTYRQSTDEDVNSLNDIMSSVLFSR